MLDIPVPVVIELILGYASSFTGLGDALQLLKMEVPIPPDLVDTLREVDVFIVKELVTDVTSFNSNTALLLFPRDNAVL